MTTTTATTPTPTAAPSTMGGRPLVTRQRAEEILHARLPGFRGDSVAVFTQMAAQAALMQDRVARAGALSWGWDTHSHKHPDSPHAYSVHSKGENAAALTLDVGGALTVHPNALQQAASLVEIPAAYVTTLLENDPQLLTHNLNARWQQRGQSRQLVRAVRGQCRAVLSDKYRRLDSRPILENLGKATRELGLKAFGGAATDLQFRLRFCAPEIYEVTPGEFVVLGLDWGNSDFGRGAHDLRTFIWRVLCGNGAVADSVLRQVHLGRRLTDDGVMSERTLQLDTAAAASAAEDMLRSFLDPAQIEKRLDGLRAAATKEIGPMQVDALLRKHLGKEGAAKAAEVYRSADVEMLPPGNTLWRLSNALSWMANQESGDAAVDLQELAGKVLTVA